MGSTDITKSNSVYFEQNGSMNNTYENYALPGTDADRDYFYGEDDFAMNGSGQFIYGPDGNRVSDDFNTADAENKTTNVRNPNSPWVLLAVYNATDETNNERPIDCLLYTSRCV